MTFRWRRDGQTLISTCLSCGLVITARHEPTLHRQQRGHDPETCQRRRLQAAFDTSPGELQAAYDRDRWDARKAGI